LFEYPTPILQALPYISKRKCSDGSETRRRAFFQLLRASSAEYFRLYEGPRRSGDEK
jgi:hypothetical protein